MELFNNETENKDYVAYLNENGRALYYIESKVKQNEIIEKNGKQLLIDLKACLVCYAYVGGCYYETKKQDVIHNARLNKITYKVEKIPTSLKSFKLVIYANN